MRIICPVKFAPDVDAFVYDYEKQELTRENQKQMIGPDDACALGFALNLKKQNPDVWIEAVMMAPLSILKDARDIARRGIDRVTLLSDSRFAGSDTLATCRVLESYIRRQNFDVILTGSNSPDGDTGHVPAELAAKLDLPCLSGIVQIDEASFLAGKPVVKVETELDTLSCEVPLPAVLGLSRQSGYRLPFVRFANLDLDVEDRMRILGADDLNLEKVKTGQAGSATKVVRTYTQSYTQKQERIIVRDDDEGVEAVVRFLKDKGYLS